MICELVVSAVEGRAGCVGWDGRVGCYRVSFMSRPQWVAVASTEWKWGLAICSLSLQLIVDLLRGCDPIWGKAAFTLCVGCSAVWDLCVG